MLRNYQRVQVEGLRRPEPVDVAARPVNYMVEPRRPSGTPSGIKLAEALASIAPGLDALLQRRQDEHIAEMTGQAEVRINGLTFEEARQARRDGTLAEVDDGWYRLALDRLYGARQAQAQRTSLIGRYVNEFDKQNGDVDQFYQGIYDEGAQEIGDNREAMNSYMEAMAVTRDNLLTRHADTVSGVMREQAYDGAIGQVLETARQGIAAGQDSATINARVREMYSGFGVAFNMGPAEVDDAVFRAASALADEGAYELVRTLLMDDRDGVGAIGNKREYAAQASDLIERARRRFFERGQEGYITDFVDLQTRIAQGRATQQEIEEFGVRFQVPAGTTIGWAAANEAARQRELERLQTEAARHADAQDVQRVSDIAAGFFETGTLTRAATQVTVPQRLGDPVVRSRSDLINDTVATFLERSALLAGQNNETFEQTFQRELPFFVANGIEHPGWDGMLNTGFGAASAALTANPTVTALTTGAGANLMNAYLVYEGLDSTAPQILHQMMTDEEASFFSALQMAIRYGDGQDVTDNMSAENFAIAGVTAIQATSNRGINRANSTTYDAINSKVQEAAGLGGWFSGYAGNIEYVSRQVQSLAEMFARSGMGADAAYTLGVERFKATHALINGNAIYVAGGRLRSLGSVDRVSELINGRLDQFATANGLAEIVPDTLGLPGSTHMEHDLTVIDLTNSTGKLLIVHRASQTPAGQVPGFISLTDLETDLTAARTQRIEDLVSTTRSPEDQLQFARDRLAFLERRLSFSSRAGDRAEIEAEIAALRAQLGGRAAPSPFAQPPLPDIQPSGAPVLRPTFDAPLPELQPADPFIAPLPEIRP